MSDDIVLCWDIDGTLLTTARGGVFALEIAASEIAGRTIDLQELPTAGLTDPEVAERALEFAGIASPTALVARFLAIYEDNLPTCLHRRHGKVMPNVREILLALRGRAGWHSRLLTGNTTRGAAAKLAHYGLAEFFEGGSFSMPARSRAEIAAHAAEQARAQIRGLRSGRIVVIGDTPHDVSCARAIGVRVAAVATGGYTEEQLASHGADLVWRELPSPADFITAIDSLVATG